MAASPPAIRAKTGDGASAIADQRQYAHHAHNDAADGEDQKPVCGLIHRIAILGGNPERRVTTLDWTGLPGGVNTMPGAIGASSLTYPDSVTGYLIPPATALPGTQNAFLPGCDLASPERKQVHVRVPRENSVPGDANQSLEQIHQGALQRLDADGDGVGFRLERAAGRRHDVWSRVQQHSTRKTVRSSTSRAAPDSCSRPSCIPCSHCRELYRRSTRLGLD